MSISESVTLRYERLRPGYLDEILTIENEAYPEPWTRGMFRQEIRSPQSHFFVAFLDETLVGYGGFWLVEDEAHITSITIRDGYRGQGLGRQLTMFILDYAAKVGARLATLEVRESNIPALNLYQDIGFEAVGRRKGYYNHGHEDAIVMLKQLAPPLRPPSWPDTGMNA